MANIFSILVLEQNPNYVVELEKKYSIIFPQIFKVFVQTFEFGKLIPTPQHSIEHPNKDLGFDGFQHTLEQKIIIFNDSGEYYKEKQMLPITPSGIYPGGICLGLTGEDTDKIFLNTGDFECQYKFISANIFHFFSQLHEVSWND